MLLKDIDLEPNIEYSGHGIIVIRPVASEIHSYHDFVVKTGGDGDIAALNLRGAEDKDPAHLKNVLDVIELRDPEGKWIVSEAVWRVLDNANSLADCYAERYGVVTVVENEEHPTIRTVDQKTMNAVAVETLKKLLQDGADANAISGKTHGTALHYAAYNNNAAAITLLLKAGANSDIRDIKEATPLHVCATFGAIDAISAFVDFGAPLDSQGPSGTPLLHALFAGEIGAAKALMDAGADLDATHPRTKETPLLVALDKHYADLAETLITRGADVNLCDQHGNSPLMLCSEKGDDRLVAHLLRRGANVNAKEVQGGTPLMFACQFKNEGIVRLLLEAGASPNVCLGASGATPLHVASSVGTAKIVRMLLAAGADKSARMMDGQTPADLARRYQGQEVVSILKA